ncbi:unnamed protein product [Ambrosiozyma monospora]|uniref:Unnamed protein product n=1 Tax=Ambrosiozyma monospora TaxID=43982 RepID=A0ACB5SVA0_AMBMO|nr:unnamed protein product [Ambrosiozyma monospora]
MLLIAQVVTFLVAAYLIIIDLKSIDTKKGINDSILQDTALNISHLLPFTSVIETKQQLHSKFPNFNEKLRDLRLGDINFLHTTDTHGWYLGHLNQRQYSSDWGDFISFATHLKQLTAEQGGDLLLVDTGDKHDGNGLTDLTTPNGFLSNPIFSMADYDIITVGNHELYVEEVSKFEFETIVPRYGDKFISTNVEYLKDDGEYAIFGASKYRYFETDVNHYKVFSLSFLFDFHGGNRRVRVTPISEIIKQKWFLDLLDEFSHKEVELVVIAGHLPVAHNWEEMYQLHNVLREYFPDTYIQYFGGHSHVRDFTIVDELSTGFQSGRYCETVGFLSLTNFTDAKYHDDFIHTGIDRKYIDFNIHSFMHHSNKSSIHDFNTEKGLKASKELYNISKDLKLTEIQFCHNWNQNFVI